MWRMLLITAAISRSDGKFTLNFVIGLVHGTDHEMSKITTQMTFIRRGILAGLNFTTTIFYSRYFASKFLKFLERHGND